MALLTTCTSTNMITSDYASFLEKVPFIVGSVGIGGVGDIKFYAQTHTLETITYVGLDEATAKTYVDNNPAGFTIDGSGNTVITSNVHAYPTNGPMWSVSYDSETITPPELIE